MFKLGVASAALTHGHPSGHLAAGALATIIRKLCDGRPLAVAVDAAIATVSEHDGSDEVVDALRHARRLAATTRACPGRRARWAAAGSPKKRWQSPCTAR